MRAAVRRWPPFRNNETETDVPARTRLAGPVHPAVKRALPARRRREAVEPSIHRAMALLEVPQQGRQPASSCLR